jgi:hypothetical protein
VPASPRDPHVSRGAAGEPAQGGRDEVLVKVSGATVAAFELVPLAPVGVAALRAPPPPPTEPPTSPSAIAALAESRRTRVVPHAVDALVASPTAGAGAGAGATPAPASLPRPVSLTYHTKTWEALDDGLPTAGISSEAYAASLPPPRHLKKEPVLALPPAKSPQKDGEAERKPE